jgi:hypothetical protein
VRLLCVAALLLTGAACRDETKKPDAVRKYCVLTSMPHTTSADLRALQSRALALFKEKQPYRATDKNRAVVNAASQLSVTANTYALQIEQPALFPGQEMGVGFPQALAQLTTACAALS